MTFADGYFIIQRHEHSNRELAEIRARLSKIKPELEAFLPFWAITLMIILEPRIPDEP